MTIKNYFIYLYSLIILIGFCNFTNTTETITYKCMIQMKDYTGEGAYVAISLLKPDGSYNETLYVNGHDDEWYFEISEWWNFYGKKRNNIDAITGATISSNKKAICVFKVDTSKINKDYKIRFETAVEDQEYYKEDVIVELNNLKPSQKIKGKGFINYIRLIKQ